MLKISIKDLVSFMLRSGDLESRFTGGSRAAEGMKAHQVLQKSNKAFYGATAQYFVEVPVAYVVRKHGLTLEVGGRIDGLIVSGRGITIEEIKTTTKPLEAIDERSNPLFWAQAKCYAYLYGSDKEFADITLKLTYYQLDTREIRSFTKTFALTELETFFHELIDGYLAWARKVRDWSRRRNRSIRTLPFPFDSCRKGQPELMDVVSAAIEEGAACFVRAPTGIGKTIATLFPAVKSLEKGFSDKVFYLTAKTVTRSLAEDAVEKMRRRGLCLKTVTITAKEKICFTPGSKCEPEECVYARGYYDRLQGAIEDIFCRDALTRPVIEEYAQKHRICPFELSLDSALWADGIICDYNYVFDPAVYLRRFFAVEDDELPGSYTFLIDEAHNLVDRGREMFSAELHKEHLLNVLHLIVGIRRPRRKLRPMLEDLTGTLSALNERLIEERRRCEEAPACQEGPRYYVVEKERPESVYPLLKDFLKVAEKLLAGSEKFPHRDELLDLYFEVYGFVRTAEYYDDAYVTYRAACGNDLILKLFCLDPSGLLAKTLERGRSAIFFSATLEPIDYFIRLLGGGEDARKLELPSPFPRENLRVLFDHRISTLYRMREFSYGQVARDIAALVGGKVGNYLVYFPSYKYLREVHERFCGLATGARVLCQTTGMTEKARAAFLDEFAVFGEKTLVGFAVMGGVFGEGIDLIGERLSGVAVVGVGLPQVCFERNLIRDYFESTLGLGFEYAYVYPGMNKVMQAVGRLIRTDTDSGVALLIDQRFSAPLYQKLCLEEWKPLRWVRNATQAAEQVQAFWQERAAP